MEADDVFFPRVDLPIFHGEIEGGDAPRRGGPVREAQGVVGEPVQGKLHLQKRRGRLHEVAERHFSREIFRGAEQQRNRRRQKIIGAGQKHDPRLTLDHGGPFAREAPQMAAKVRAIAAISLKRVVLFEFVPNRRQRVAKIAFGGGFCSTLATSGRPNIHMLSDVRLA